MRFEGKVAVVTGAGYGIGEIIAKDLAREGAKVVLAARSKQNIERVAQEIRGIAQQAEPIVTDVSDESAVVKMIRQTIKLFGRLDILINNAGIAGPTKLVTDIESAEWLETLQVNLTGAFYCSKHAARKMVSAGGGAVVNISSVGGRIGYPYRTPYAASKWGMIGLSHSMAAELGEKNIRVNVICPGPVAGERMDRVIAARAKASGMPLDKAQKQAVSGVPLGRMVTPEEVSRAVLFLVSDEASGITGQAFCVDGGLRMQ